MRDKVDVGQVCPFARLHLVSDTFTVLSANGRSCTRESLVAIPAPHDKVTTFFGEAFFTVSLVGKSSHSDEIGHSRHVMQQE